VEFDRVDCFDKISVRIPRSWVATEGEEVGTFGFYDPSDETGTLRVSLFTYQRGRVYTPDILQEEEFEERNENGVEFFRAGEHFLAEWNKPARLEDDVHMFWWSVSTVVAPKVKRRALFSYAVPEQLFAKPEFRDHLKMIRECVFATHFIAETSN
jgi:hypothetical protein